jgi:hypothetical protein
MAVNPREPEEHRYEEQGRVGSMRSVRSESAPPARRGRTIGIIVGIVLVIAIAVVAYMALYGGSGGGGSGGGTGGGVGGYFIVALSADGLRKMTRRILRR